ncbi:hypothetical protein L484_018000 [Morus notabilis]|uniref:FLZ-type domain-containing protein n=1 Tax=Morus notabilis TaxID=981085 RepID=W9R205_9ROSA|nr:uncharacterized protein LOC21400981 [Morus notabilis]EXB64666.1 hypothetical protein L484_018000 [Morus notabilis]
MLLKFRSPFKLEEDHDSPNKPNRSLSCNNKTNYETDIVVGLRIVEQISSQGDQNQQSNVVVKSAVRLSQPTLNNSSLEYSCFLKTCNLCNKELSLDKEVYMYRGDQGFCSIECRDRQIFLDEMRELEASTKQMIASYRSTSCSPARHETRILLEDLRQRDHKPIPNHRRNRAVVIS